MLWLSKANSELVFPGQLWLVFVTRFRALFGVDVGAELGIIFEYETCMHQWSNTLEARRAIIE